MIRRRTLAVCSRCHASNYRRLSPATCLFALCAAISIAGQAVAGGIGDGLWNLRENGDDRFHSNESIVRPWRYNYDDGVGKWVGNHSYDIPWTSAGTIGDGSGGFSISRGRDQQWSAWTWIYLTEARVVEFVGTGDCVPVLYVDKEFDAGIRYVGDPIKLHLSAGRHRVDITGYNQNSGYTATFQAPSGVDGIDHLARLPCSIADLNGDGQIDLTDFFAFFNCFDATASCADIDSQPGVDLGDFFSFFNAFDAGCEV